uniref:Uncharacterized protein n=1 Tax=Setaria italica TaxID=4555 RepID=K3XP89_SETIT
MHLKFSIELQFPPCHNVAIYKIIINQLLQQIASSLIKRVNTILAMAPLSLS